MELLDKFNSDLIYSQRLAHVSTLIFLFFFIKCLGNFVSNFLYVLF